MVLNVLGPCLPGYIVSLKTSAAAESFHGTSVWLRKCPGFQLDNCYKTSKVPEANIGTFRTPI